MVVCGVLRLSDGPGDQPEPRAHALHHWLWVLREPQDQWHVFSVL